MIQLEALPLECYQLYFRSHLLSWSALRPHLHRLVATQLHRYVNPRHKAGLWVLGARVSNPAEAVPSHDRVHEVESENYAKAVLRCVRCSFDTFSFEFSDKEFRERFFEGVVLPLQADWEFATGGKI